MAITYRPGRSQTDGQLGLVRHLGTGEYNDDIYLHTAAKPDGWNVGDRRQLQDGRVFYLSKAYAAPTAHATCDYGRTMSARNTWVSYATTNCQGGTLGEHTFKVTGSSISEGDYAGGFMYLTDATNTGTRKWGCKIISNTASATVDGVSNTVILELTSPEALGFTHNLFISYTCKHVHLHEQATQNIRLHWNVMSFFNEIWTRPVICASQQ